MSVAGGLEALGQQPQARTAPPWEQEMKAWDQLLRKLEPGFTTPTFSCSIRM